MRARPSWDASSSHTGQPCHAPMRSPPPLPTWPSSCHSSQHTEAMPGTHERPCPSSACTPLSLHTDACDPQLFPSPCPSSCSSACTPLGRRRAAHTRCHPCPAPGAGPAAPPACRLAAGGVGRAAGNAEVIACVGCACASVVGVKHKGPAMLLPQLAGLLQLVGNSRWNRGLAAALAVVNAVPY